MGEMGEEDLEGLDLTACKEKIQTLQADRERRREHIERLQEKLKNLNSELADRGSEMTDLNEKLEALQKKNKARETDGGEAQIQKVEDVEKERDKARTFIEESLNGKMKENVSRNQFGFRVFDETDLMVEKPLDEQFKEQTLIDTVLIVHHEPFTDLKYRLSYRVDKSTTARKLREDACRYWRKSEVEYILKTVTNSKVQDDITIQNLFHGNEEARLILMRKTPLNNICHPDEMKAYCAKTGAAQREFKKQMKAAEGGAEGGAATGKVKDAGTFEQQLSKIPGLSEFMHQRDQDVKDHLKRVSLRSLLVYLSLAVLTMTSVQFTRPETMEYTQREGALRLLGVDHRNLQSGSFDHLQTIEDVWNWLTNTVSATALQRNSTFRQFHHLAGAMQVRTQQSNKTFCQDLGLAHAPDGSKCIDPFYSSGSGSAYTSADMELVSAYWDALPSGTSRITSGNVSGRNGTGYNPGVYEADIGTGVRHGQLQQYSPDGFVAEYNLTFEPNEELVSQFMQDMQALKRFNWLSTATRSLHVEFTAYNGNYDRWLGILLLVEFAGNGEIHTKTDVFQYQPVMVDFAESYLNFDQRVFEVDVVRLVLVLIILCLQIPFEIKYQQNKDSSAWQYLRGATGVADVAIVVLYIYIFLVRHIINGVMASTWAYVLEFSVGFKPGFVDGILFHQLTVLEGFVFLCAMLRWLSFMRVNRNIFIIWLTIRESCRLFFRFFFVFVPLIIGLVTMSQAVLGDHSSYYKDFSTSFVSTMMTIIGDFDPISFEQNWNWAAPLGLILFVAIYIFLVNGWLAVMVEVYQSCRVRAGYYPTDYQWEEWEYVKYTLWRPFLRPYFKFLRKKSKKPPELREEDDEWE